MNMKTLETPNVADLVIADPRAAAIFERFGIDYCCHGHQPLASACASAGVAEADVRDALGALGPAGSRAGSAAGPPGDIGALIGLVVGTYHTGLRRELPRLGGLFTKVLAAHGERHPELAATRATFDEIADDFARRSPRTSA